MADLLNPTVFAEDAAREYLSHQEMNQVKIVLKKMKKRDKLKRRPVERLPMVEPIAGFKAVTPS